MSKRNEGDTIIKHRLQIMEVNKNRLSKGPLGRDSIGH